MSTPSRFPILLDRREREELPDEIPRSVPWGFVEPHERQAQINHSQTLKRLADRGGLGLAEMYAVVTGSGLREVFKMPEAEAWPLLEPLLKAHQELLTADEVDR